MVTMVTKPGPDCITIDESTLRAILRIVIIMSATETLVKTYKHLQYNKRLVKGQLEKGNSQKSMMNMRCSQNDSSQIDDYVSVI